jgi:hypothetical protein
MGAWEANSLQIAVSRKPLEEVRKHAMSFTSSFLFNDTVSTQYVLISAFGPAKWILQFANVKQTEMLVSEDPIMYSHG